MRRIFVLCSFCLLLLAASAQEKGFQELKEVAAFKAAFATASAAMKSFRADFTQEKNLSLLSEKIKSAGQFSFKKENKVRMEYRQPFDYLLLINGNYVTIKEGKKTNTISVKSNKLFQKINQLTVDCVSGRALTNGDFTSTVFESANSYLLQLVPRSKEVRELFSGIQVYLDKKDYTVSKINMVEKGGDNTLIVFSRKEMNIEIPDALFTAQ
ncbi:MAG TPA: outer membrane lipoprotein carrier protein LolA [Flavihumibacter sp.]|nr:outer membrane lipoprotein carrier protein LolA [Bacteroidota bacterium]HQD08310.1 outer membrane lipoprotein carrier protein LolA [Flavihumibacter sp.]